jgi:hypothetical protein
VDASSIVALAAVLVGAVTSVAVPYVTFRHTRQIDETKRMHEQRDELYVDLLAEAHAEHTWAEYATHLAVFGPIDWPLKDTRLSQAERARLGARTMAFAEPAVMAAWNRFAGAVGRWHLTSMTPPHDETAHFSGRLQAGLAFDELGKVVRAAVGAVSLVERPQPGGGEWAELVEAAERAAAARTFGSDPKPA